MIGIELGVHAFSRFSLIGFLIEKFPISSSHWQAGIWLNPRGPFQVGSFLARFYQKVLIILYAVCSETTQALEAALQLLVFFGGLPGLEWN